MRVAYFSAGEVGAGHMVRGLAIARALARAGRSDIDYRIFYAGLGVPLPCDGLAIERPALDRDALSDPHRASTTDLAMGLRAFAPDVLLVDLFWAPLRYVLPTLSCEAWLLVRDCPPGWLGGAFHAAFDGARYARVFGIEPGLSVPVRETIDPIVACNPEECLPRAALRHRVGAPAGTKLALVAHVGAPGEIDALSPPDDAFVVRAGLDVDAPIVPLAPWLPGADAILGGAGYNLFWETRWLGLAARSTLRPFPRTIDDQARRLRLHAGHVMRENGADALVRALR